MDATQIVFALLVALCGGFLQGTVGFGFGLVAVPLLLTIGIPVTTVIAAAAICASVQAGSGVHHLRQAVPWKIVGVSASLRAAGMLLGIGVLRVLAAQPMAQVKFWVALVVLCLVALQGLWQPHPRPKLHGGWNVAAFLASGFTGGLCAMGGPPLVLWVMAHDWTAERTRAFLFASFMSLVPIQLAVLYWTFGHDVLRGMAIGAALAPAVLLGSFFGLRVGSRFSKPLLRRLAFLFLAAIAGNAMFPQLVRWVQR